MEPVNVCCHFAWWISWHLKLLAINSLIKLITKKTWRFPIIGLLSVKTMGTGGFSSQRATYKKSVSMTWHHHSHSTSILFVFWNKTGPIVSGQTKQVLQHDGNIDRTCNPQNTPYITSTGELLWQVNSEFLLEKCPFYYGIAQHNYKTVSYNTIVILIMGRHNFTFNDILYDLLSTSQFLS